MMLYMTSVLSYNTGSIKNRGEIDHLNFKIKKLYKSKNTIKKWKDSLQSGKEIFANRISGKCLVPRIYEEFLQIINNNK